MASARRKAATVVVNLCPVKEVTVRIIVLGSDDLAHQKSVHQKKCHVKKMDRFRAYRIQRIPSQKIILSDIGAELLPKNFRRVVAICGRIARVPVHLRQGFASVAPFAFENIGALGTSVAADVAINAVVIVNELTMLCGRFF